MLNPYDGVNWETAQQIMTTTHDHVYDQAVSTSTKQHFNNLYNGGVRCFAISNYYPSAPMYPLSDWTEELDEPVPDDIIEIPNSEHHHFRVNSAYGNSVHLNPVGSTIVSGKPRGEDPSGYAGAVETFIPEALSQLLYADGGGITVNHPKWTQAQNTFPDRLFSYLLDLDDRVLGIEMYSSNTWDLEMWDSILCSGRRCWGFAVPDHKHKSHADWTGREMLIVPELTQHECLRAIRNGCFYAKIANTELRFTKIAVENNALTVTANASGTIRFIADGITVKETTGTTASYPLENVGTYIRAEVETENDRLFTNPVMLTVRRKNARHFRNAAAFAV